MFHPLFPGVGSNLNILTFKKDFSIFHCKDLLDQGIQLKHI